MPSALTVCVIGISEEEMLDAEAATEMSRKMDRFLRYKHLGYQLEEIKEHSLGFKVTFPVGVRGYQEVKVDLLLSPYYANQKALLDKLVWYKSAVRRDEWPWIVRTYVRLVRIYRFQHKYTCIGTILFVLLTKIYRFSASASKWQVEFIERFPNQVCLYSILHA